MRWNQKQERLILKKIVASDEELYQLLSAGIENDSQFYLPKELIQAITINAHTITEWRCYEKHGACLENAEDLVDFIQNQVGTKVDIKSTANSIKACLNSSGKSLSIIHSPFKSTALHLIMMPHFFDIKNRGYYFDTLCQAAGNDSINLLFAQNDVGFTALHYAVSYAYHTMVERLISIAGDKASELASIKDNHGRTALTLVESVKTRAVTLISNPQYTHLVFEYRDNLDRLQLIIELLKKA